MCVGVVVIHSSLAVPVCGLILLEITLKLVLSFSCVTVRLEVPPRVDIIQLALFVVFHVID